MRGFAWPAGRPAIMGVLNVTPDSFSDGGLYPDAGLAVEAGLRMFEEGADIIDVGGESTRPGAEPVSSDEEISRVAPVIDGLVAEGLRVSIDTHKPEVAKVALDLGAAMVNDISGLRDPDMVDLCAKAGCGVCVMHMLGTPKTMQAHPVYGDVLRDVKEYLLHACALAEKAGVDRADIWIDPGIGFGKTLSHNLELLRRLDELVALGYPVLVGVSRKSFIGRVLGAVEIGGDSLLPVDQRLEGTLAAQVVAQVKGARALRVHDVSEARRAAVLAGAILGG